MTAQDEAVIEAVQNAIDGALPGDDAKEAIRAYLSALDKAGWAVVLKDPDYGMTRAASESKAKDDEGEFVSLGDHIDYSGENKTHTVIREALRCAVSASPPPPGADTLEKK